jgi:hypothetical protein
VTEQYVTSNPSGTHILDAKLTRTLQHSTALHLLMKRLEFLDRAYELGCTHWGLLTGVYSLGFTHWDSAAMYGDNETLLRKWFERTSKRSEFS